MTGCASLIIRLQDPLIINNSERNQLIYLPDHCHLIFLFYLFLFIFYQNQWGSIQLRLNLFKSTIRPSMEYRCNVWAGAPNCYFDMLDKVQYKVCRSVGPSFTASVLPLTHVRNVVSLRIFVENSVNHYTAVNNYFTRVTNDSQHPREPQLQLQLVYKNQVVASLPDGLPDTSNRPLTKAKFGFKFQICPIISRVSFLAHLEFSSCIVLPPY